MKHTILLSALTALLFVSCSNSNDPNATFKNRGVITGPDYRRCISPCCGGWFIEIEGRTYRFLELPPGSDVLLLESNYPIPVQLSWSRKSTGPNSCENDLITVHSIKRE